MNETASRPASPLHPLNAPVPTLGIWFERLPPITARFKAVQPIKVSSPHCGISPFNSTVSSAVHPLKHRSPRMILLFCGSSMPVIFVHPANASASIRTVVTGTVYAPSKASDTSFRTLPSSVISKVIPRMNSTLSSIFPKIFDTVPSPYNWSNIFLNASS